MHGIFLLKALTIVVEIQCLRSVKETYPAISQQL